MERACDFCGTTYQPKRSTSKYCSKSCNVRMAQRPKPPPQPITATRAPSPVTPPGLIEVTERELSTAGRLDSTLGQQAVALAQRIVNPHETGAGVASLSRELRAVLLEALKGTEVTSTWVDEMAARRARRAG